MARARRASGQRRIEQSDGQGQYVCPECGRAFARPQALGAHRRQVHGVAGSSRTAVRAQRRGSRAIRRRSASGASAGQRAGAGGSGTKSAGRARTRAVDRDALLRSLFPDGIPAREEVVRAVNSWLDEADRLATMR
jgi:C2H2-type zinc finger